MRKFTKLGAAGVTSFTPMATIHFTYKPPYALGRIDYQDVCYRYRGS